MAARRNRRGRRRNRGRFGFLYKLLSFLVILAAILVGCIVFFRVDRIEVVGQSQYTEAEIIAASGVERGDNLFRLNKNQIAQRVLTGLPYVDKLSMSRRWPDTLVLTVSECVPVAVVEGGGERWLLDAACKVLERGDASLGADRALVLGITPLAPAVGMSLAVDEPEQQKLQSLKKLLSALADEGMTGSVTSFIDLSTENRIHFGYGENLTVTLPLITDFDKDIYALKKTLWRMDEDGVPRTGTLDFTVYTEGKQGALLMPERWIPGDGAQAAADAATAAPTAQPGGDQGADDEDKKAQ